MTNTRTQSNLRLLKSRNQRDGWYAGCCYKRKGKFFKLMHMRHKEWGIRFTDGELHTYRKDHP